MRRERSWSLFPQIQATNLPLAPASILPDLKVKVKSLSRVRLFATSWTVAHQAPPPMGFSRQEYWSGLPFPSPGDLPHPGIELRSPTLQADALTSEPNGSPYLIWVIIKQIFTPFSQQRKNTPDAVWSLCWRHSTNTKHWQVKQLYPCSLNTALQN